MKRLMSILFTGFTLLSFEAVAHSYQQGDIRIGHIWMVEPSVGDTSAAVNGPLFNTGKEQDRLIGASSSWAEKVEFDECKNDKGDVETKTLDAIILDSNKPVPLRSCGIYLNLVGLKKHPKAGEWVPLTLKFEKAGIAKVEVMVKPITHESQVR
jgi:periplasmic copper chaperone A